LNEFQIAGSDKSSGFEYFRSSTHSRLCACNQAQLNPFWDWTSKGTVMHTYRLKGASGKVANQSFALGARTIIGRSDNCDLRIEDENLAPQHARITLQQNGGLVLEQVDLAFATYVNGAAVDRVSLASGDEIRMGSCRWVLQAPGLRPEKVLTAEAVKHQTVYLPWLIVIALLAAATLAWERGWLPF